MGSLTTKDIDFANTGSVYSQFQKLDVCFNLKRQEKILEISI